MTSYNGETQLKYRQLLQDTTRTIQKHCRKRTPSKLVQLPHIYIQPNSPTTTTKKTTHNNIYNDTVLESIFRNIWSYSTFHFMLCIFDIMYLDIFQSSGTLWRVCETFDWSSSFHHMEIIYFVRRYFNDFLLILLFF